MTIAFSSQILEAATLDTAYSYQLSVSGGIAPYTFALISGILPTGLTMNSSGLISGTPTQLGAYTFIVEASDSTSPTAATGVQTYTMTVVDIINLSSLSVDQVQFVTQFQNALAGTNTWSTGITSSTSQTLIDLISAIGTFITGRLVRVKEDAFSKTAQSDSAIYAITDMLGIRLSRKSPAQVTATLANSSTSTVLIPAYTQMSAGGYKWFNPTAITLPPSSVPVTVVLKEGTVVTYSINGLGTNHQAWVSNESGFEVSDQDVQVTLNGAVLYKAFGLLWNYPNTSTQGNAFADRTTPDGRLMLQFGAGSYGAVPGVNDVVVITYATTSGSVLNTLTMAGASVSISSMTGVTGVIVSDPSGGADQKTSVAYKNFSSGTFGTFSSAVTPSQYNYIANSYPSVVDAVTQPQRTINPSSSAWMNVTRVSALSQTPWTQQQITAYLEFLNAQTMYSTQFLWQEPQAVYQNVVLSVYFFNSVGDLNTGKANVTKAITKLFAPRPGLLRTDFFPSDLDQVAKNSCPGQISYVTVDAPTTPMIVSTPSSPHVTYSIVPSGGSLQPSVYSYAVSANAPAPNTNFKGLLDARYAPFIPVATAAGQYWIVSYTGTVIDSTTNLTYNVTVGDQLLALGAGSGYSNFTIYPQSSSSAVDVGVPSNWTFPQVTVGNSVITLDWSADQTTNAIQYFVWGRTGDNIGILTALDGATTRFIDDGTATYAQIPITAVSTVPVRYNALQSLTVNVFYANRQQNVVFPVRDTLN